MISVSLEGLELDELGRVRLSDDDLSALDEMIDLAMAGGDPTVNGLNCAGTTNSTCQNQMCNGSTNTPCSNTSQCNQTTNNVRCTNRGTGEDQEEIDP